MHTAIPDLYEIYLRHPSIRTDTRKLQAGDIFFALKGPSFDGNAFARQALEAGAAYVVADDPALAGHEKIQVVDDVLSTLQALARHHRLQLDIPFIAITGSNGKTTTKELVTHMLAARYKTYATEGNLNNHIGVPLTILRIRPDAEMAVIEMGANHRGEIASYCEIALPGYGLITNCGKAHLEGFGGIEGVRKGKGELYDFLRKFDGTVFRFADPDYLEKMAQGIGAQLTYGTANADIVGKALHDGFFLDVAILNAGMETTIHTQLVGDYNLPNVLAAVAVGHFFKMDIDTIKAAIESYIPSNSRSQLVRKGSNSIISDAYNANPASMKLALENLSRIESGNKWLMLGAMKEMGTEADREHQALVDLAQSLGFGQVILVGEEFKAVTHPYRWFPGAEEAAAYVKQHRPGHAVILVKGSRGSKMEKILEVL